MPKWGAILGAVKGGADVYKFFGLPGAKELMQGVHVAEAIPGLKGPQKREAAKAIARELIGDDGLLRTDPELQQIADQFIDAYVALLNRIAVLRAQEPAA
jgi:hypothetical protein